MTIFARVGYMAAPISRAVLQIGLARAIVWATAVLIYPHWRRLPRHAERTDWPA
jgi:hypothetical protein